MLPRHAGNRSHSDRSRHPEGIEDKRSIECGVRQKEHLTNIFGTDDNRGRAAITLHTNLAHLPSVTAMTCLLCEDGRLVCEESSGSAFAVPHACHRGALSNAKVTARIPERLHSITSIGRTQSPGASYGCAKHDELSMRSYFAGGSGGRRGSLACEAFSHRLAFLSNHSRLMLSA